MKGILLKDMMTLKRTMLLYLVLIVFFCSVERRLRRGVRDVLLDCDAGQHDRRGRALPV